MRRGNGPGGIWSASGGYEPIARDAFDRFTNLDTLLLEYALGDERSFAWLVSPDGITAAVLPRRTVMRSGLTESVAAPVIRRE